MTDKPDIIERMAEEAKAQCSDMNDWEAKGVALALASVLLREMMERANTMGRENSLWLIKDFAEANDIEIKEQPE